MGWYFKNELETQFGHIYEDIIDHIIDAKESHSGLDIDIDHNYDYYDDDSTMIMIDMMIK